MSEHMFIYVLVKKYLKYTLQALKIPMPSKRDTITIFTRQFMYKVDIKQITPTSKLFINIISKGQPNQLAQVQNKPTNSMLYSHRRCGTQVVSMERKLMH